jgi:prolipoprotein diacylglyceryl transferase
MFWQHVFLTAIKKSSPSTMSIIYLFFFLLVATIELLRLKAEEIDAMNFFVWDFDPEIFRIGEYGPRYYGLLFACGFLIGYYIMQYIYKREGRKEEDLSSLLLHMMLGTIIGARLGHCFFYEPEYFLRHPLEVLFIWRGGLASHGGTIGVIISVWLYSRKHPDQPFSWIAERVMAPIALAAAFIRVGNFFNSEIIGNPTNVPWAVVFKRVDDIPRHPSMLYEALAYLILFVIMMTRYVKLGEKIKPYIQSGILFTGIFAARFFIEMTKKEQVDFEKGMLFNMGQILSIPFIIVGILMLTGVWNRIFPPHEPVFTSAAAVTEKSSPKNTGRRKTKKK